MGKTDKNKSTLIGAIEDILPTLNLEALDAIWSACRNYSDVNELPVEDEAAAIHAIVEHIKNRCDPCDDILPEEYNYSCLPLCLLDAVFSIGVRYESTRNVVKRYCEAESIERLRQPGEPEVEHNIDALIKAIGDIGPEAFAKEIVKNGQLTSSKSGILKAEAVLECAKVLKDCAIYTIEDFREKVDDSVEKKFREVKGQTSGISFSYLKMLCGDVSEIKPDRHVLRFLAGYLGYEPALDDAKTLLDRAVDELNKPSDREITPREVDYLIWSEMVGR